MITISSPDNERIKFATLLKSDAGARRDGELCFTEGLRLCREAFKASRVKTVFVTQAFSDAEPDFTEQICADSESWLITDRVAKKLSDTDNPQGIFCLCSISGLLLDAPPSGGCVLLDRVSDPGNLGTVMRTAEAFSAAGLILTPGCADPFSPKVLRASMGGIFRLKTFFFAEPAGSLARLKEKGFDLIAAMPDANAAPLPSPAESGNFVLVIGNEANGVCSPIASLCRAVTIPMSGGAESLNAAAAASILLWEFFARQKNE